MTDSAPSLDAPPDADQIADLREQAAEEDRSIEVTFPDADDESKRFVVSPRGTCVVLTNTRENSFNPSATSEDIASALRE